MAGVNKQTNVLSKLVFYYLLQILNVSLYLWNSIVLYIQVPLNQNR